MKKLSIHPSSNRTLALEKKQNGKIVQTALCLCPARPPPGQLLSHLHDGKVVEQLLPREDALMALGGTVEEEEEEEEEEALTTATTTVTTVTRVRVAPKRAGGRGRRGRGRRAGAVSSSSSSSTNSSSSSSAAAHSGSRYRRSART